MCNGQRLRRKCAERMRRGCEEREGAERTRRGCERVRRGTKGSTKRHPSVQHLRRDKIAVSLALILALTWL